MNHIPFDENLHSTSPLALSQWAEDDDITGVCSVAWEIRLEDYECGKNDRNLKSLEQSTSELFRECGLPS